MKKAAKAYGLISTEVSDVHLATTQDTVKKVLNARRAGASNTPLAQQFA